jgi:hypothetical protein
MEQIKKRPDCRSHSTWSAATIPFSNGRGGGSVRGSRPCWTARSTAWSASKGRGRLAAGLHILSKKIDERIIGAATGALGTEPIVRIEQANRTGWRMCRPSDGRSIAKRADIGDLRFQTWRPEICGARVLSALLSIEALRKSDLKALEGAESNPVAKQRFQTFETRSLSRPDPSRGGSIGNRKPFGNYEALWRSPSGLRGLLWLRVQTHNQ